MKRRPLILIVILMWISELYGQPGKLARSEIFSTNEGLGHRIALDIDSDSIGQYFINSPLGLQRYSKGQINATAQIANLSIHQSMILNGDNLVALDIDNCVHVFNKNDFNEKRKYCISEYIEGEITLVRLRQNKLLVLNKIGASEYKLYQFDPTLESFELIFNQFFESYLNVLEVSLNFQNEISFIDTDESFHHLGENKISFDPETKAGALKMEAKIFENFITGVIYFSFHTRPGVFSFNDREVKMLQPGFIHTYNEDQQGDVVIGVSNQAINFVSDILYIEKEHAPVLWNEVKANNDKILDIHSVDFSSDLTIASYNGLYHYFINPMHVQSFLAREGVEQGDFGVLIRCIGRGHDNKINAIKESGELVYDISYDSSKIDSSLDKLLGYGSNWFEYIPQDTAYYFGSYNGDFTSTILKYHVKSKEVDLINFPMTIERFFMDQENFWAVGNLTESGKVLKINRETGQQESLFEKHLLRKDVRSCLLLKNYFLVGTNNGLLMYDRNDNTEIDSIIGNTENLHVTCIRVYNDHYFLGTQNEGLKIFNKDFEQVKEIEIGTTRPSNTVAAIEQDTFDNFWVSTFDGLTVLNKDLLLVEKIELEDGLSSSEFNRDASFKDNDGTLYFGNLNGITRINPTLFLKESDQDEYLIDEVKYSIGSDQFFLSPETNNFKTKGIPDNIQIRYFHPGFGNKTITNLKRKEILVDPKPDSIAIDSDLIKLFGLKTGSYDISVNPRYGLVPPQSISSIDINYDYDWIRRIIVIVSIVSLISYLISSWIISIIRKESEAKIKLQTELSDIRMKALRSQLNPHFIFNSLNSIQYYIQVNDKRKARDYLSKFARLMRMVLQSSHDDVITLDKELEQLKIYLELEKLRFEDSWVYEFNIDNDINADLTTIPSMLFQPIIENAIIHGLGNLKEREGLLSINIKKHPTGILATIEDNGVGRIKSIEINNKKLKKSKSLSTSISKERIALYNKFENDTISIDYIDKYSKSGEAIGTLAKINITTT